MENLIGANLKVFLDSIYFYAQFGLIFNFTEQILNLFLKQFTSQFSIIRSKLGR